MLTAVVWGVVLVAPSCVMVVIGVGVVAPGELWVMDVIVASSAAGMVAVAGVTGPVVKDVASTIGVTGAVGEVSVVVAPAGGVAAAMAGSAVASVPAAGVTVVRSKVVASVVVVVIERLVAVAVMSVVTVAAWAMALALAAAVRISLSPAGIPRTRKTASLSTPPSRITGPAG